MISQFDLKISLNNYSYKRVWEIYWWKPIKPSPTSWLENFDFEFQFYKQILYRETDEYTQ